MHLNPTFQPLESRRLLSFGYSMTDLGVIDQPLGSAALDMNDQGIILTSDAIWTIRAGRGRRTDINASYFTPRRLGTNRAVAGAFFASNQAARLAYTKQGIRGQLIEPPAQQRNSVINALNSHDSAVGQMKTHGSFHAFLAIYHARNFTVYGTADLTLAAAGLGLNVDNAIDLSAGNQILVTGRDSASGLSGAAIASVTSHGLRFLKLSDTGSAGEQILPRELNDMGQATGLIQTATGSRAVLWSSSRKGIAITTIPTLGGGQSAARGLNNLGLVVGYSTTRAGEQRATLFDRTSGRTRDLNLLADTLGMTLRLATSVNNSGQIAAEATDAQGEVHAVILIPTDPYPVPPSGVTRSDRGIVFVNGTGNKDEINIGQDSTNLDRVVITFNKKRYTYDIAHVQEIRVHAGGGDDAITLNLVGINGHFSLYGDRGDDSVSVSLDPLSTSQVSLYGGEGDDRITTSGEHDHFFASGDDGNDTIIGRAGADTFWGGAGDDLLQAGDDVATLKGESGNDSISGSIGRDAIGGGSGDDSISSLAGNDVIDAGAGNDFVDAGDGADDVLGGWGDDSILGGNGNDYVYGDQGNDSLFGEAGDDTLGGDIAVTRLIFDAAAHQAGNDFIDGGRGRDYLLGSTDLDPGNDTLLGGEKGDTLNGRSSDSMPDATADDVIPRSLTQGNSPFVVEQTADIVLKLPDVDMPRRNPDHRQSRVTVPAKAGDFTGSPIFAESDNVIRMRSHLNRDFTLGEFFDNWGIYVDGTHFGGYGAPPTAGRLSVSVTVNGQPFSRERIVQPNDILEIVVAI